MAQFSFGADRISNYESILRRYDAIDLLTSPLSELCHHLSLTKEEVKDLVEWISKGYYDPARRGVSVTDLLDIHREDRLSLGNGCLDKFFKGGIPTRAITEVSGVSGSGKTQLSLQMCAMATLEKEFGGLNGSVIVIAASRLFNVKALKRISEYLYGKFGKSNCERALNMTGVIHISDAETLAHVVRYQIPEAVRRMNCRLVVISGISSVFTYRDEDEEFNRSEMLLDVGLSLKKIAYESGAAVVCLNGSRSAPRGENSNDSVGGMVEEICCSKVSIDYRTLLGSNELYRSSLSSGGDVPALGLLWESLTTLKVSCILKGSPVDGNVERLMSIMSPYHDYRETLRYQITDLGISELKD